MQTYITEILGLQGLAKEVHWNAKGPGFIAVHKYLDEVDDSCAAFVDEIAEHMAADGRYGPPQFSVGQFETFPQYIVLTDADTVRRGLSNLVTQLDRITNLLDNELANDSDDPAGEDILVRALQEFNKHLWFLSNELG